MQGQGRKRVELVEKKKMYRRHEKMRVILGNPRIKR